MNQDNKRYRNFSLLTYLSVADIKQIMFYHDKHIKAYAFIIHDKDTNEFGELKEKHIHLLISTYNAYRLDSVRNWFKGYTDKDGKDINTLAQPMHDICSSYEYLTHDTEKAKQDGKYIYSKDDIEGVNLPYFQDSTKQDIDNLTLAIDDLLNGEPLDEVRKRYGRDFIMHYGHIKMLFNDIQKQNGGTQL